MRKAVGAAPGMGADDSSDSDDSSDDESLMAQSTKNISDTLSTIVSFQVATENNYTGDNPNIVPSHLLKQVTWYSVTGKLSADLRIP